MFCNCGYFNNPFLMRSSFGPLFMAPNMFFNNMFWMFSFMSAFRQPLFMPFQAFTPMSTPYYIQGQSIFDIFSKNKNQKVEVRHDDKTVVPKSGPPKVEVKSPKKKTDNKGFGPEFLSRTKQIAQKLNCDYKDLLAVMNSESGMNSKVVNRITGATGLIQFMPSTAKELGTSVEALKNMSPTEQLKFVEKYLLKMKKAAGFNANAKLSASDLYALVFLPGRAKREVLTDSSEKYYGPNKGLDLNKDGKITKDELGKHLAKKKVNESIFA